MEFAFAVKGLSSSSATGSWTSESPDKKMETDVGQDLDPTEDSQVPAS